MDSYLFLLRDNKSTIRNVRLLISILLMMLFNPLTVKATSLAHPPIISLQISTLELGVPTFSVVKNQSYAFGTTIDIPGGYLLKGDVYFGVYLPGKDKPFTWVKDGGLVSLQNKMTPIAKGIVLKEQTTFSLSNVLGQTIQYKFTGTEPSGMYLVFALMVAADSDPSNTQNWIGINMAPLFFNP